MALEYGFMLLCRFTLCLWSLVPYCTGCGCSVGLCQLERLLQRARVCSSQLARRGLQWWGKRRAKVVLGPGRFCRLCGNSSLSQPVCVSQQYCPALALEMDTCCCDLGVTPFISLPSSSPLWFASASLWSWKDIPLGGSWSCNGIISSLFPILKENLGLCHSPGYSEDLLFFVCLAVAGGVSSHAFWEPGCVSNISVGDDGWHTCQEGDCQPQELKGGACSQELLWVSFFGIISAGLTFPVLLWAMVLGWDTWSCIMDVDTMSSLFSREGRVWSVVLCKVGNYHVLSTWGALLQFKQCADI